MFRYRCPKCRQTLQAPEIRAGKATVCPKCSSKITIPADPAQWLTDAPQPATTEAKSKPEPVGATRQSDFGDVMAPIHVGMGEAAASPKVEAPAPRVDAPPPSPPEPIPAATTSASTTTPPPAPETQVKVTPAPPPTERPQPRRVVTTSSASNGAHAAVDDSVSFNQSLHLRSEMDIAAALTDVLTSRMKPPPKPPRDLNPSTAFWLILTGIGVILLSMTLFKNVDYLQWVKFIGWAEVAIGYIWIVVLAFRRAPASAAYCAIPPVTFWYLVQKRYRRYRPLRFVATGALLVLFGWLAPRVLTQTRQLSGADEPLVPPQEQDASSLSKVEQVRLYRDKRQFDRLIALLRNLDRTEPLFAASPGERVELAAELQKLADPAVTSDPGIRAAAIPAYVRWSGNDARGLLLAAIQGHPDERKVAIQLLHKWRDDPDVARVLASRLGNRDESDLAKNALVIMDPATVIQAIKPLLSDKRKDKTVHLAALDLLAVAGIGDFNGGDDVIKFLQGELDKFTDQALNRQVQLTILRIKENLSQPPKS